MDIYSKDIFEKTSSQKECINCKSTFQKMIKRAKTSLKKLRTDNDADFCNRIFQGYLKGLNIELSLIYHEAKTV